MTSWRSAPVPAATGSMPILITCRRGLDGLKWLLVLLPTNTRRLVELVPVLRRGRQQTRCRTKASKGAGTNMAPRPSCTPIAPSCVTTSASRRAATLLNGWTSSANEHGRHAVIQPTGEARAPTLLCVVCRGLG